MTASVDLRARLGCRTTAIIPALADALPPGQALRCFTPPAVHVDIHPYALHLWGRMDGASVLPNFGAWGTI